MVVYAFDVDETLEVSKGPVKLFDDDPRGGALPPSMERTIACLLYWPRAATSSYSRPERTILRAADSKKMISEYA